MAAKSVVLSTENRQVVDKAVYHSAPLALFTAAGSSRPVHSNW